MFIKQLAAAIKVKGAPLKEVGENVYMPFGSEYSIMLHNYGSTKAKVNIDIDDERVFTGLVVKPNDVVDLDRWQHKAHKFKFIERTKKVEAKRGIRLGDGLVRITYQFETILAQCNLPNSVYTSTHLYYPPGVRSSGVEDYNYTYGSIGGASATMSSISCNAFSTPVEQGITVQGSVSDQTISSVPDFLVDPTEHVMVFKLNGRAVEEPIKSKDSYACKSCGWKVKGKFCANCGTKVIVPKPMRKNVCPTCGTENKDLNKYCSECGTNLE